jgi:hypothetical protein
MVLRLESQHQQAFRTILTLAVNVLVSPCQKEVLDLIQETLALVQDLAARPWGTHD